MSHETSKAVLRRTGDSRFATRYFVGDLIDIGAGDDSLAKYKFMYPGLVSVRSWDVADGDAELMLGVADDSFDCIASSHCWEHMYDPYRAFYNWVRICKSGGYLVIVVPDFQQYEQGFWPSRFNLDHKWCFSISGQAEHAHHIILLNTLALLKHVDIIKLELVERGYVYGAPPFDQSLSPACEPAIEVIMRKR